MGTSQTVQQAGTTEQVARNFFGEMDRTKKLNPNLVTKDFRAEIATAGKLDVQGLSGLVGAFYGGFPDLTHHIKDVTVNGNTCAFIATVTGTHRGNFNNVAPTGKKIEILDGTIVQVRDGKVASVRAVPDVLTLLRQIGALPPT